MKMRGIYYLNEPTSVDADLFQIRIMTDPDEGEKGGHEYALDVTTIAYIQQWMKENKKEYFYTGRIPHLILPKLDDQTIIRAVKELLPIIDEIASRTE